jgi:hypothetical protein
MLGTSALEQLESMLRRHWRLGQNMVLCWAPDPHGLLTIVVPHYFLGNFTATHADSDTLDSDELFVRQLISESRRTSHDQIFEVAHRLGVSTSFIKLDEEFALDDETLDAVDAVISRYSLGFVENRAVALFDIAEFSLFKPFQQASQLNSLSYSMNSAHTKLKREGVEVNFARTTTGDGYYVWNRDTGTYPNLDLLTFFLLVLIDNAAARSQSAVGTVPLIRAGFHVGSHYELSQAEGVNPTVFSYIVGDVTIELARLLDDAEPGAIRLGNFSSCLPDEPDRRSGPSDFLSRCRSELLEMNGLKVADRSIDNLEFLDWSTGGSSARSIELIDKHGKPHTVHSVGLSAGLGDINLELGIRERL